MISLAGLTDDYLHDGRVLIEIMTDAVPPTLRRHRLTFGRLASVYKAINAPMGGLGMKTLRQATTAIQGDDATYIGFTVQLKALTDERNTMAGHMIQMIEGAEFTGIPFNDIAAQVHVTLGQNLLEAAP
jgi:hypothetical protein